jgi:hypothetical protein
MPNWRANGVSDMRDEWETRIDMTSGHPIFYCFDLGSGSVCVSDLFTTDFVLWTWCFNAGEDIFSLLAQDPCLLESACQVSEEVTVPTTGRRRARGLPGRQGRRSPGSSCQRDVTVSRCNGEFHVAASGERFEERNIIHICARRRGSSHRRYSKAR